MKIDIKDFKLQEKVSENTLKEYNNILPKEILNFWEEYGLGSFRNGYLKSINPLEWKDILEESSVRYKNDVPLFVTGMGDLVLFSEGHVRFLDFRHKDVEIIYGGMQFFFPNLYDEDDYTMKSDFKWQPYLEAREKYGDLAYDECFGYVPLLALGGSEKVENLEKVKVREHILLNVTLTGPIL